MEHELPHQRHADQREHRPNGCPSLGLRLSFCGLDYLAEDEEAADEDERCGDEDLQR